MNGAYTYPSWFSALSGVRLPGEGQHVRWGTGDFVMRNGLLRDTRVLDDNQRQTRDVFAYKWKRTDSYRSDSVDRATNEWLIARYGDWSERSFWSWYGDNPLVLDAGCGSGNSARLLIGPVLSDVRYVGVDLSEAVDVAADEFRREGLSAAFLQANILDLPFGEGIFDVILSEGVLHHTPSTRSALQAIARHLKPGGMLAFYVYRRKSPIREFTDDYIREHVSRLDPNTAWSALLPLTRLGKALGELKVSVDVPEDIALLGISKGQIDLQRLFYWHICKMYYRPEYSIEEMNHVNFDWFTPVYSQRQTPDEVRDWCKEAGLSVKEMRVEDAGITTLATRST